MTTHFRGESKADFKTKPVTPRRIFTVIVFVLRDRKKFGEFWESSELRRVTEET
jgi:hypothetical protein